MTDRSGTKRPPDKAQRLSAALRENLRRRKAQAKSRKAEASRDAETTGSSTNAVAPHDSAGFGDEN
jgi:hypothetical protein